MNKKQIEHLLSMNENACAFFRNEIDGENWRFSITKVGNEGFLDVLTIRNEINKELRGLPIKGLRETQERIILEKPSNIWRIDVEGENVSITLLYAPIEKNLLGAIYFRKGKIVLED